MNKPREEETIKQVNNIVQSLNRIHEKRLSDERIDTAVKVNFLLKQAEKNKWHKEYINALKDVKKVLKITNTIYDLYV